MPWSMRSAFTLLLAFLVSSFVGGMAQTLLAVASDTGEEFSAILMLFLLSAVVAIGVFGTALFVAKSARGIDGTALGLLVTVAALIAALAWIGAGDETVTFSAQDLPMLAGLALPTALMIGIQWWLVRRRWRRGNGGAGTVAS